MRGTTVSKPFDTFEGVRLTDPESLASWGRYPGVYCLEILEGIVPWEEVVKFSSTKAGPV